ncbi:nuclear transport factor 2 family protein [Streptomyces sp. TLI_146]|uniref:nuclear transport factor 2 family protein n=1 Tax=Streptomyces sp. TLI_146 TaxID=1938858 RepID=UPI0015D5C3A1|nr:nuclear transport factor 2 family protein [Streptomyces sp. TLI_146]
MDRTLDYLSAGAAGDVAALDAVHDPGFESIRCDGAGRVVALSRAEFLSLVRAPRERGQRGERMGDIGFLATSEYDGHGAVIVRRVQGGVPVLCTFVWRREEGEWTTLLRAFTFAPHAMPGAMPDAAPDSVPDAAPDAAPPSPPDSVPVFLPDFLSDRGRDLA